MKWRMLLVVVLVAAAIGVGWHVLSQRSGSSEVSELSSAKELIMVDELRERPERFAGEIKILGVVNKAEEGEGLFGLIDKREADTCATTQCAEFLLPVSWKGQMLQVGDTVIVNGHINKSPQGLILVAGKVEKQ
ncbi:MAG: hypothetical protein GWP14_08960 [Actinobacteria bacterium]|nr:hypothetical protein [Actinomycetota bacterium]